MATESQKKAHAEARFGNPHKPSCTHKGRSCCDSAMSAELPSSRRTGFFFLPPTHLLNDQLAQTSLIGADFELERTMVEDFQGDLAAETGVNGGCGDVSRQAQASELAASFDAGRQLALERQGDFFQGSDQ